MKINIHLDETLKETEVTISAPGLGGDVEKIMASLRMLEKKITGSYDGQTYILDAADILYIDTADKKTFLYTTQRVYDTPLKLYELEEQLAAQDFIRASKSCILNFNRIQSLRADLDSRLLVTMENGERLVVSRQYATAFKQKLGGLNR